MTVYVDMLFMVNTAINYLLLRGSAAMGGCPAGVWRLLGAAVLGGLYAVSAVLPGLEPLQGLFFQIIIASGMLVMAFGWKRNTVKQGLFFFALSFAFSGLVMLAVQVLEPDCLFLGGRAYYGVTTPALLLLAGISYGLAAAVLGGWGGHTGGDIVPVSLELNGRKLEYKALRDTGNTLRDPVSGQNIPVASWQVLACLLPEAKVKQAELSDPSTLLQRLHCQYPQVHFRLVSFQTVGVSNGLLLAVKCGVGRGKRLRRMPVAFTATDLSAHGQYEILLGGAVS